MNHTWYLSIDFQFILLCPIFLLCFWRLNKKLISFFVIIMLITVKFLTYHDLKKWVIQYIKIEINFHHRLIIQLSSSVFLQWIKIGFLLWANAVQARSIYHWNHHRIYNENELPYKAEKSAADYCMVFGHDFYFSSHFHSLSSTKSATKPW